MYTRLIALSVVPEKVIVAQLAKKCPSFMQPKISLSCSQKQLSYEYIQSHPHVLFH
jgi:hypothetical protein